MNQLLIEKRVTEQELKKSKRALENRFQGDTYYHRKRYYGLTQGKTKIIDRRKAPAYKRPLLDEGSSRKNWNARKIDFSLRKRSRDRSADSKEKRKGDDNPRKRSRSRLEIKKEKIKMTPRVIPKTTEQEKERNKRFMSIMCSHIKKAKKDFKEEANSTVMKNRKEMDKRVNEAINKDRIEYKKEYQRKMRAKAELLLRNKERKLRRIEIEIRTKFAEQLIKKLSEISEFKSNFLLTETTPPIFYLPNKITPKIKENLEICQKLQKLLLEKDIKKIKAVIPPADFLEAAEEKDLKDNKENGKKDNSQEKTDEKVPTPNSPKSEQTPKNFTKI